MKSQSPALAPFHSPAALRRSIQFAAVMYRYAAGKGLPMDAVLEGSALREEDFDDPDFFGTHDQELRVLRNLASTRQDPALGFDVGRLCHLDAHTRWMPSASRSARILPCERRSVTG